MAQRGTGWRVLQWSGVSVSGAIAAALLVSVGWSIVWISPFNRYEIGLEDGALYITWRPVPPQTAYPPGRSVSRRWGNERWPAWWFKMQDAGSGTSVVLPLWLVLVVFAGATAVLLWRGQRRTVAGCCAECGYDLTGNTSGRCPECGTPIKSPP